MYVCIMVLPFTLALPKCVPVKFETCFSYNKDIWIAATYHVYLIVLFPLTAILHLTRPMHRRTDANLYPPERQLTKASEPSFDLEGGTKGQI